MIEVSECGAAMVCIAFIAAVGWLCYVIHSIARAADALERIADAMESQSEEAEEEEEEEVGAS